MWLALNNRFWVVCNPRSSKAFADYASTAMCSVFPWLVRLENLNIIASIYLEQNLISACILVPISYKSGLFGRETDLDLL